MMMKHSERYAFDQEHRYMAEQIKSLWEGSGKRVLVREDTATIEVWFEEFFWGKDEDEEVSGDDGIT